MVDGVSMFFDRYLCSRPSKRRSVAINRIVRESIEFMLGLLGSWTSEGLWGFVGRLIF